MLQLYNDMLTEKDEDTKTSQSVCRILQLFFLQALRDFCILKRSNHGFESIIAQLVAIKSGYKID